MLLPTQCWDSNERLHPALLTVSPASPPNGEQNRYKHKLYLIYLTVSNVNRNLSNSFCIERYPYLPHSAYFSRFFHRPLHADRCQNSHTPPGHRFNCDVGISEMITFFYLYKPRVHSSSCVQLEQKRRISKSRPIHRSYM